MNNGRGKGQYFAHIGILYEGLNLKIIKNNMLQYMKQQHVESGHERAGTTFIHVLQSSHGCDHQSLMTLCAYELPEL